MNYIDVCCENNINRVFLCTLINGDDYELKVVKLNGKCVLIRQYDDEDFCRYYPEKLVSKIVKDITPLQQLELF